MRCIEQYAQHIQWHCFNLKRNASERLECRKLLHDVALVSGHVVARRRCYTVASCWRLSAGTSLPTRATGMRRRRRRVWLYRWQKRLYALMARNTRVGYEYFRVPNRRLLEIGAQIEI